MVLRIFLVFVIVDLCSVYGNVLPLQKSFDSTCTQEPRDIFLMVDGSSSVQNTGFSKVRQFILSLIRAVDVREDMTHFGLLQFSTREKTKIEFSLDESHDANVLLEKVENLKYQSGPATRTGMALGIVDQEVFTLKGDDRPLVKDYLIIFTDGQATDRSLAAKNARKLKDRNVRIIAIGAGPQREDFREQLEAMATSTADVFMADFGNLESIMKDIVNEVCPEPTLSPSSMICTQEPRDVFLVVDGSLSIGEQDFEKIRQFLVKLVKSVVVNPKMTHFGLLQFSTLKKTRIEFSLDYSHRESTLLNLIRHVKYQAGDTTRTGHALKIVDQKVFTVEGDDRPQVQDILIVFTDGATRDQEDAKLYAQNMKNRGVHIMGIAAGPDRQNFKHQLVEIASSPDDVIMVEFDNLDNIIGGLVNKVCKPPPTTAPPTTPSTTPPTTPSTTTPAPTTTPTMTSPTTTTLPPTTTPPPTTPPPICTDNLSRDVLIMVDSPVTMRSEQFSRVKEFLKQLASYMTVENRDFMVSIMQLHDGATPNLHLDFSSELSSSKLMNAIEGMKQGGVYPTFDVGAFGAAGYEFHKLNYKYGRREAEDVIILITTRYTSDASVAAKEIQLLQRMGVKVISLAVGRQRFGISMQLQQVTGNNKSYAAKFRRLNQHVLDVIREICPRQTVKSVLTKKSPIPSCRRRPYDIFFVVDGSASIKSMNFVYVRKFLMDLIELLRAEISNINIGLLQFSEVKKKKTLLKLDQHSLREQMKQVDTMEYQAGRKTMTGDALAHVRKSVFNGQLGDRPGVENVLIIFTDGNAHDLPVALEQASLMKKDGVRIITIGAGVKDDVKEFENELTAMASDPETDALTVDFKDLSGFANKAFPLICTDRNQL